VLAIKKETQEQSQIFTEIYFFLDHDHSHDFYNDIGKMKTINMMLYKTINEHMAILNTVGKKSNGK